MGKRPVLTFSHVGIWVTDLETMRRFYTDVLGFVETDRGPRGRKKGHRRDPRSREMGTGAVVNRHRQPFRNLAQIIAARHEHLAGLHVCPSLLPDTGGMPP